MPIPTEPLIVTAAFGPALDAARVAAALSSGLGSGGGPAPRICLLPDALESDSAMRARLQELVLDARLRSARAVILGAALLEERTLARSATFEIATRARQSGVPAYAVTGENRLSSFDARMLDLQLIVEAGTRRALIAAGRRLASAI
jgi:glycerate kinase